MDVNVAVAVGDVWMGLLWSLRSGAGAFGLGLTETLTRFLADLLLFFVNFFLWPKGRSRTSSCGNAAVLRLLCNFWLGFLRCATAKNN